MLRMKRLLMAALFIVGWPALAGETFVLVGPAVGNVQNQNRHLYGSLELRHLFHSWGKLSWGAGGVLDVSSLENYEGLNLTLQYVFSDRWSASLTSGPGRYSDHHYDLGSHLEFRSGLELFYHLGRGYRLGIGVFHYSNGGVARHNPGTESVRVALVIPL
ncbi:MAG: acyloxyacyl hydrolase [Acidobacteriota bacterium]